MAITVATVWCQSSTFTWGSYSEKLEVLIRILNDQLNGSLVLPGRCVSPGKYNKSQDNKDFGERKLIWHKSTGFLDNAGMSSFLMRYWPDVGLEGEMEILQYFTTRLFWWKPMIAYENKSLRHSTEDPRSLMLKNCRVDECEITTTSWT